MNDHVSLTDRAALFLIKIIFGTLFLVITGLVIYLVIDTFPESLYTVICLIISWIAGNKFFNWIVEDEI